MNQAGTEALDPKWFRPPFSVKRSLTVHLKLVPAERAMTDWNKSCSKIDVSVFPEEPGAYVIRYLEHKIPRHRGESEVIRIGSATKTFRYRFEQYNHPYYVTHKDFTYAQLLEDFRSYSGQKTNANLMFYLAHWREPAGIVVDLYYSENGLGLETQLLAEYCEAHHELPPLNLGFK